MNPKFHINQKVFVHPEIIADRAAREATITEIVHSRISKKIFYVCHFPATEKQSEVKILVAEKYISINSYLIS